MAGAAESPEGRDASIDWMRAGSILYIAGFWHLNNYTDLLPWYGDRPFFGLTVAALALFVLISGYLVGRQNPPLTRIGLARWYRRRLIRLYPPYAVALVVFYVGGAAVPPLTSALLIAMLVPPAPFTLWFVTMIVLFYVIAPFLLRLAANIPALVASVTAAWACLFALRFAGWYVEPRLLIYLPVFAAGILLGRHRPSASPRRLLALAAGAACGYAFSQFAPMPDADMKLWQAPWALLSATTIFLALSHRLPRVRLVEQVSIGSYFLYLFHRPIYIALLKVTGASSPLGRELLLLGLGLPAAIVFGIAGQHLYDSLVTRIERRRG